MTANIGLKHTFALSRRFLLMLDAWPEPHSSLSQPSIRFVFVICILSIYVIIPQLTNVIRAWGNVMLMVEYIASVNISMMAIIKLSVTRYHGETLQKLTETVSTDWTTSSNNWERNTMLKVAARGRILSLRCYASSTCTSFFYIFFNSLKFYHSMHHPPRKLVYHFIYPYDTQKSPNYEITFVVQIFGGLYTAFINSTVDSFVSMFLLHVCSQLINLRISLKNLVDDFIKKSISYLKFKEDLAAIVMRHDNLIRHVLTQAEYNNINENETYSEINNIFPRNARTIDKCYSMTLFVHMIIATFQLCFESFQLYTKLTDKNADTSIFKMAFLFFYTSLVVTHLYIYCYSAEMLISESTKLAYGVYESKWYDMSPKEAKNLMLIVYRSMKPLKLTAGKFGMFSMEMFGATLKTSMGYLSALLTLKD